MSEEKTTPKLKTRPLGNSGLLVSEICLGSMTFSTDGKGIIPPAGPEDSIKMIERYIEWGGNFIDTANIYGTSEELIGQWLSKGTVKRESLVIASKVRGLVSPNGAFSQSGPNESGLSRKHIIDAVELSLKKLQTPYLDLYQLHWPDLGTPIRETLSTLNDLVRSGKIRYIGISNFNGWQLQKAIDLSAQFGWEPIVSAQQQYSLLSREIEYDSAQVCKNEGVGILPWSPLKGGWLSGRYKRGMAAPPEGSRVAATDQMGWEPTDWKHWNDEFTWKTLDAVEQVAGETKKSFSQVSLRWLLQKDIVSSVIIGARKLEHLEDNLGAATFTLTPEQMAKLDEASSIKAPYPFGMYWNSTRGR